MYLHTHISLQYNTSTIALFAILFAKQSLELPGHCNFHNVSF